MAKKQPRYAVSRCPVCDKQTVKASGFVWRCETCGYTQGRSYKRDPSGCSLGNWHVKGERITYRQEHGLPYEKVYNDLPEELTFYVSFEGVGRGRKTDEYRAHVGIVESRVHGRSWTGIFGSKVCPQRMQAVADAIVFLNAQDWTGKLTEDNTWNR